MKPILITIALIAVVSLAKAQKIDTLKGLRSDTLIFSRVEHTPEFPGGMKKFYKFLAANIKYPQDVGDTYGKVFLEFIVEKDGSLSRIHVIRGLQPELDAEAIRVLELSPKWNPGTQNGRIVRVYYDIPIDFTIHGQ